MKESQVLWPWENVNGYTIRDMRPSSVRTAGDRHGNRTCASGMMMASCIDAAEHCCPRIAGPLSTPSSRVLRCYWVLSPFHPRMAPLIRVSRR